MAKRRRKKPNISEAVLEQARQGSAEPVAADAAPQQAAPASADPAAAAALRRRRTLSEAQLKRRKDQIASNAEYAADLLANPTKVVTEEDLRADYGFVIKDLRNMGMLAAVLFVALIIISLVLL